MIRLQVSAFAAVLAAAGIPLYIHLPRYASSDLGLSLSTVGGILIAIRFMDFLQDPLLGRMIDRFPERRALIAWVGMAGLALGFVLVFSVTPGDGKVVWLTASLVLLFTAFSLTTILFYGQGVSLAGSDESGAHYRLAAYRETGTLIGIVLSALAPTLLMRIESGGAAYRDFGILIAGLALVVCALTMRLWQAPPAGREAAPGNPFSLFRQASLRPLLFLALANALPVAITSTLFLFYVEDRLGLGDSAGVFLLLFFIAAAISAPLWTKAVDRFGVKQVLVPAMALAIVSFIGVALLPKGAALAFTVICIGSGAALGADLVILPALFATALSRNGLPTGAGFGLWSFATKLALAVVAAVLLPFLQWQGFTPDGQNGPGALRALTLSYAVLPCLLKMVTIVMVLRLPETVTKP